MLSIKRTSVTCCGNWPARRGGNAERAALKLDPKNSPRIINWKVSAQTRRKKDLAEAIAELKKAIALDPRQFEVRFELIAAYRGQGDLAQRRLSWTSCRNRGLRTRESLLNAYWILIVTI